MGRCRLEISATPHRDRRQRPMGARRSYLVVSPKWVACSGAGWLGGGMTVWGYGLRARGAQVSRDNFSVWGTRSWTAVGAGLSDPVYSRDAEWTLVGSSKGMEMLTNTTD